MQEIAEQKTKGPQPSFDENLFGHFRAGLLHYYLSSLIVVLGVAMGHEYLKSPRPRQGGLLDAFANWDGKWYREIAETGYSYDPAASSNVAFFPAFPLLGRLVSHLSGLACTEALLLVSHACLALTFLLLAAYTRARFGPKAGLVGSCVLLAFGPRRSFSAWLTANRSSC
jgi:hypothetical protein